MKKSKATIHDISKALGIHSSTVSRALHDSPLVSQKTKDKIKAKSKELGYRRNSIASSLRSKRSFTIGVIVPRISRHFFSSVIAGVEETAFDKGYDVMICQSLENLERERKLIDTLSSNRVDGVLISISMETKSFDHFEEYQSHGNPLIFFDRPVNLNKNTNVIIDDFKASYEATEHLINRGCSNIVHLSGPLNLEMYQRRLAGYKDALKNNSIAIREDYILESHLMESDGVDCAKQILDLPVVDAVFSANDTAAISAMQYLKTRGIKIPKDIAFVGFSNEPVSAVIEPSLTTVNQPGFEMGKVATTLLIEQIESKGPVSFNETKFLIPKLIIRNSSPL